MPNELTNDENIRKLMDGFLSSSAGENPWEAIIALSAAADFMRTKLGTEALMRSYAQALNPRR